MSSEACVASKPERPDETKRENDCEKSDQSTCLRRTEEYVGWDEALASKGLKSCSSSISAAGSPPKRVQETKSTIRPRHRCGNESSVPEDENPYVSHIISQPETQPISQEHLVSEVKSIDAGLVMVESKCIEVDSAQNTQIESAALRTSTEQQQALIALHRTLHYEHHDFFLASQHPAANPTLRRLAQEYDMPARIWRHGIHSSLELLQYLLSGFLDHTITFISMMALLYETIPLFGVKWTKSSAKLGTYRMAAFEYDPCPPASRVLTLEALSDIPVDPGAGCELRRPHDNNWQDFHTSSATNMETPWPSPVDLSEWSHDHQTRDRPWRLSYRARLAKRGSWSLNLLVLLSFCSVACVAGPSTVVRYGTFASGTLSALTSVANTQITAHTETHMRGPLVLDIGYVEFGNTCVLRGFTTLPFQV